jgi:hypothetical protein
VEITNRGGGDWSIDKAGNLHWSWSVPPISERRPSVPTSLPRPRRASDSSLERL